MEYVVELYQGEAPTSVGTDLQDWDGELDAETMTWLGEQGYGTDNPDLWVNIVSVDEWAPRNHPIVERRIAVQA